MRHIQIREWDSIAIGEGGVTEAQADALHLAAMAAARRMKLQQTAVLERGYHSLRSRQVCGVLIAGGVHLEILPKLEDATGQLRETLVHMLAVAYDLPLSEGEMAALSVQNHSLIDTFIHLFLSRLNEQTRQGLMRLYIGAEDVLPKLRGRLDFRQQIQRQMGNPSKLHCRYEELSEDIALNRIFKACIMKLRLLVRSARTRRLLEELTQRFADIHPSTAPLIEKVQWNRMSARFETAHQLAIMLLRALSQSTTSGNGQGIALLFPMNDLFEKYVGRSLQHVLPSSTVNLKDKSHHLLTNKTFALKPDIVIDTESGPLVIDTKWKDLDWDGSKLKVQIGDLYQLAAYAAAYQGKRVILLYPADEALPDPKRWTYEATGVVVEIRQIKLSQMMQQTAWQELARILVSPLPNLLCKELPVAFRDYPYRTESEERQDQSFSSSGFNHPNHLQ